MEDRPAAYQGDPFNLDVIAGGRLIRWGTSELASACCRAAAEAAIAVWGVTIGGCQKPKKNKAASHEGTNGFVLFPVRAACDARHRPVTKG
jgi:hypothetical protein